MDELARALHMDPLDLRLRHYASDDQLRARPYTSPDSLRHCYERAAEAFGWRTYRRPASSGPKRRGIGMAAHDWDGSGYPPAYAWVKLNANGTAEVITGTQDIGTGTHTLYLKAMDRKVWAFALVSVAATLRLDGSRVAAVHLVLGGVAPIPWRASVAEQELLGAEVGEALFACAADAALSGAEPLRHNAYKAPLAKSLIRRALTTLASP